MAGYNPDEIFDATYYAYGCGIPYERNEHWLSQFTTVAERIVADIQPATVLDAGCALGLLVETLRDRGVEAYGVDVSSFAIDQVYAPIKPFCWVGSISEPLPQRYDLIVCIEVLEHMQHREAEAAIVNLCRYTDDLLFSSSPDDYREATHFNVQPPEYWAAQFARQGLYRDTDFDAAFVTPWAVRFRRRNDPFHKVVQGYERRYWMLRKESSDLRALTNELRGHTDASQQLISDLQQQVVERDNQIAERDKELRHRQDELDWSIRTYHYLRNDLQSYIDRLQADLSLKISHVEELKATITRLESGRVMQFLRRLERHPAPSELPVVPQAEPTLPPDPYQGWIAAFEPSPAALAAQRAQAEQLPLRPLISLITPVFNPPPEVLAETIDSVRAQTYANWELCLVDGGSFDQRIRPLLEQYAREDGRIRVRFLKQNLGISGNSNIALELAQGEFVMLFDHDDMLAPNALFEVARLLSAHPATDIVYYDEDKIDAAGLRRHSPWFKPATWSPDTLLATNVLMHSVIRRTLVAQVGGFNPRMDGAQDWDLALRCSEQTSRIRHLPLVLYHWRQVDGSAASHVYAKPWALEAQALSITGHLRRSEGFQPLVTFPSAGTVQVIWPTCGLKTSLIILHRDQAMLLRNCLTAVRHRTRYLNYELVLVDLGSTQPETAQLYAELASDERCRILHCPSPASFAAAANLGAHHATGDRLVLLGSATEPLNSDWLEELVGWGERAAIGVVGAKLLYPDGTIKHAGLVPGLADLQGRLFYGEPEPAYSSFGASDWYRTCTAVSGEALLLRRETFAQLGGFDETYQGELAALDLCLRAGAAGYRVVYTPFARLLSHSSPDPAPPPADALRAAMSLRPLLETGLPFFNPSLSPAHLSPRYAKPGEPMASTLINRQLRAAGLIAEAAPDEPPANPPAPGAGVILVTPDLDYNDAALMLVQLARQLIAQGQTLTLLAAAGGPLEAACAAEGLPLHIDPQLLSDARVGYQWLRGSSAVVVSTAEGWRLVHAARAAGVPALWWLHEGRAGLASPDRELAAAAAATLVVPAATMAPAAAKVIAYGLAEPPPLAAPLNLDAAGRLVVVVPGALAPCQGQDTLLRAVALLPEQLADQAVFCLIGASDDWIFAQSLARLAQPLSNVRLLGDLPPELAAAYLAAADIVALPPRAGGLPLTLLEAMARGKALVATAVGAAGAAISHGQEALLFPAEDYHELARALALLIGDAALRQRLGEQARARFQHEFTSARFGQAMAEELSRIMVRRPPAA